jgi:hypothetical protein
VDKSLIEEKTVSISKKLSISLEDAGWLAFFRGGFQQYV